MKIFVSTCNSHDKLLKPFVYLFNKFWGPRQLVTILGYRALPFELPQNFNFVSLGVSKNTPEEWATDLQKFFQTVEDEHFIWALEDLFILRPVNFSILENLLKYTTDDRVGRIGLTCGIQFKDHQVLEAHPSYNVIEQDRDTPYRISVIWSIWKKEYLLQYLEPGLTPWDVERKGSEKAKTDGYRIIGTQGNHTIDFASACRPRHGGTPDSPLDFSIVDKKGQYIDEETAREMIENKIVLPDGRVHL